MKKIIIILFVLLAIAGIGWKFLWNRNTPENEPPPESKPQVVTAENGPLRVVVEATGRVVPEQEVEIKCKASGEVIKLPVDVSDMVKKGMLLVQLDPEDEERSLKRAEVALAVSEAKLAQAKQNLQVAERDLATERTRAEAALASAEAKAQETKAKLERVQQLLEKKMASREELDGAQTANAQAAADLQVAQAQMEDLKTRAVQIESRRQDIKIAEAQVEADKIALSDARQRLADTTVTAPIDGVVAEKNVQVGQIIASGINNVGGGTTMMTLADMSRIYVLVSVDESDIGRITIGQAAQITVDAHPDIVFPGEVVRIATKGANTSNVVTFEVKVEVKGPNKQLLKPEMTANVEITALEKDNVLLVPVSAVEHRRRERFVTVQKSDGATEERVVQTGASNGETIELTSGLSQGEKIILPQAEASGRWQRDKSKDGENARKDMMKMRMMGGGRK